MKKALGEVDYSQFTRIRPNTHSEQDQLCWVHIRRGNCKEGTGALMHVTPEMSEKGLKVGDVVFFGYSTQKVQRGKVRHYPKKCPKFLRQAKVANQAKSLLKLHGPQAEALALAITEPKKPQTKPVRKVVNTILRPLLAAELKSCMMFHPNPPRHHEPREQIRLRVWDPAHH